MSSVNWIWDANRNQYVAWSEPEGCWVLQDGTRLRPLVAGQSMNNGRITVGNALAHATFAGESYASSDNPLIVHPHQGAQAEPTTQLAATFARLAVSENIHATKSAKLKHGPVIIESAEKLAQLPKEQRKAVQKNLDKRFQKQKPGFFTTGKGRALFNNRRVFRVLWPEHLGDAGTQASFAPLEAWGESFMVKIHWFVVLDPGKHGEHKSRCLPINTYGNRGMAKPGLVFQHHAVIHTKDCSSELQEEEDPNGTIGPLLQRPIRVIPSSKHARMAVKSRLNYKNIHTIDHRCKVLDFGNVHPRHMVHLRTSFSAVWAAEFAEHHNDHDAADTDEGSDEDRDEERNMGKGLYADHEDSNEYDIDDDDED